jgi:L-fuculose-phosphate aldolase
MIAAAGGSSIRCAPYQLFGSQELSDAAIAALEDRRACLLANHGMITVAENMNAAVALAVEVELLCEQYIHIHKIGRPNILTEAQMKEVLEKFKGYGSWSKNNARENDVN